MEGTVISDTGIITTIYPNIDKPIKRRSIKIRDDKSTVRISVWNDKVNQILTKICIYLYISLFVSFITYSLMSYLKTSCTPSYGSVMV